MPTSVTGAADDAWTREHLRAALEAARVGTWDWDVVADRVAWSPQVEAIFGLAPGAFEGTLAAYVARLHPEDRDLVVARLQRALADPSFDYAVEHRVVTPAGEVRWVDGCGCVQRDAAGKPLHLLGTVMDVTRRVRTEDALRRVEDVFRTVVEDQTEMIVRWRPDGTRTFVNQAYCRTFGKTYDELVGTSFLPLVAEPYRRAVAARIASLTPAAPVSTDVHQSLLPDGTTCWQEWTDRALFDAEGNVTAMQSVGRDVTLREEAVRALSVSEERFRSAMEHSPIGMAIVSPDLRWLDVNPALCHIVGLACDEITRLDVRSVTHPDDAERDLAMLRRMLAGDLPSYSAETRYRHKDGHDVWVQLNASLVRGADGEPRHFIAQVQDISERKAAEAALEQLHHSQKLETVGRLAGGIAHDFNNLLTVIQGQLELVRFALRHGRSAAEHVEPAMDATRSAAALTRQLLLFARKQPAQPEVLDLNEVVSLTQRMLLRLIDEDVALETRAGTGVPPVWMDRGKLEQVLLNLAVNAKDAMPAGGTLTIETEAVTALPAGAPRELAAATPAARLRVRDTGVGMDAQTQAQIFEPFFTTKGPGVGTGLGLATVQAVVREAGGLVEVESAPGAGARFDVYLPGASATAAAAKAGALDAADTRPRRTAIVALVEDQAAVRAVTQAQLELLGYEVLAFASGEEAVATLADGGARVDVLMTDVVMRGMHGPATVERLRARRPDLHVLYMSGYSDETVLARGLGEELVALLRKPFTLEALARALGDALEPSGARA